MRPVGCAIQYAAGGLEALLDRRRPVVARATGGLELGAGSILGSIWCGGTGLPQASGLFVSLPFRRAIARLVPSM